MRQLLVALSLGALTLGACTSSPADQDTTRPTVSTPLNCDKVACLTSKLYPGMCDKDRSREATLAVANYSTGRARYKLDYYALDIALKPGGDLGIGAFEKNGGLTKIHHFKSSTFGKSVAVSVVQLTEDGKTTVATQKVEIKLSQC